MANNFEKVSFEEKDFASQEDVVIFHQKIQEKLNKKAQQMDISVEQLMSEIGVEKENGLIADMGVQEKSASEDVITEDKRILDWESLNSIGNSDNRRFTLSELRQIENDVLETIDKYPSFDDVSSVLDFARKNKNKIQAALALLYFSSLGTPFLESLADNNIEIEKDGKLIDAKDLLKNADIGSFNTIEIPEDILRDFSVKPLSSDSGLFLKFVFLEQNGNTRLKVAGSGVYDPELYSNVDGKQQFNELEKDVFIKFFEQDKAMDGSADLGLYSIDLKNFENNRSGIESSISSTMHLQKEVVHEYFDALLEVKNSGSSVSLIPIEDVDITKSKDTKGPITLFYESTLDKYNISIPMEKEMVIKECEDYARNNGYGDFWQSLNKESLESPFSALDSHEVEFGTLSNIAFTKLISQDIKKHYDIDELKGDPDKAYQAVLQTLVDRLNIQNNSQEIYELEEALKGGSYNPGQNLVGSFIEGKKVGHLPGIIEYQGDELFSKDIEDWILNSFSVDEIENSGENPTEVIQRISSFVALNFGEDKDFSIEDRCKIFMGIKHLLAEKGLGDFDKFGVVLTMDSNSGQPITEIITTNENGDIIASVINFSLIDVESMNSEDVHNSVVDKLMALNRIEELRKTLGSYDATSIGGYPTLIKEKDKERTSILQEIRKRIGRSK